MTERERYLFKASSWTHHHPYTDQPRPKVECPYEGYELFPGWQILIMLTSRCNTKCRHCYLPYNGSFDPNELPKMITSFQSYGYNVYLNGGEPLIEPAYLPAFKLADQKIVMTNGLILLEKPDYINEIRDAGIETIGVSYHFDIHEKISSIPLEIAEAALYIVESAGIHARVMTTITKPFIEKIPEYCSWCYNHKFTEIRFTNFIAQGMARKLSRELILNEDDRKRYYEIICKERAKYDKKELCITSCGSFGACGSPNMSCMSMHDFVVLAPNYKVYPCFFQTQSGMECGIYRDGLIYTVKGFKPPQHDCTCVHLFNDSAK